MSINIGDKPEFQVVNVGEELTQDQINAINAGSAPATGNPFLTQTAGNAAYARLTANNTLTGTQAYNINSAGAAFRISQAGTGEAFRVEDQTTPDTSPFVILGDGKVTIGTATASGTNLLTVNGNISASALNSTGANAFLVTSGSLVPLTITNAGTGNSFVVNDQNSDTTPFVINNDGSVGIKRSSPSYDLDVNGTVNLSTLRFADGTTMTTKPPENPFDQALNTYNNVTFSEVTCNNNLYCYNTITSDFGGDTTAIVGAYVSVTAGASNLQISATGITFPDNTVQTTAATGGSGLLDVYEQTVTWDVLAASSPTLTPYEFASRMTNNGMANTAFQDVGAAYASTGCGKARVTYSVSVEITSFPGHSHGSPSGQIRLWNSGTSPYGDLDPTNPSSIAYAYSTSLTPTYYDDGMNTKVVMFNDTMIVGNEMLWTFPNLNCSEQMGNTADWRITVYLKIEKGV